MTKSYQVNLLFIAILLLFFILQFHNLVFEMPNGIHEWAQGDRLALAYGYYENGMNFFKPSTLSQFSKDGITGVEFPIQAYITAMIAKLFGKAHISLIFRLQDTLVVGVCLYYLFRIATSFTKNFLLAVWPSLVLLLSPSFLNYTCNYMPDPVSVGILLVGMGQYLQCWVLGKGNKRYSALALCLLSSLMKTSSGIYLIGFVCFDLFTLFHKGGGIQIYRRYVSYLILIAASLAILVAYFMYNQFLNKTYDSSLFLLNIRPINSKDAKYFIFKRFPEVWMTEYFIMPFYVIGVILVIYTYFQLILNERLLLRFFLPLILILLLGIMAVSYLMGSQFIDHDYYIIPILFPFIVLHVFIFIILIGKKNMNVYYQSSLGIVTFLLLIISYIKTQERLSVPYKGFSDYYNTDWMRNGSSCLDSLKISKSSQIVVLNEAPPNLSLVYFDRKGYALNKDWWNGNFQTAHQFFVDRKVEYGVWKLKDFLEQTSSDGSFYSYFTPIGRNQNFIVFRVLK